MTGNAPRFVDTVLGKIRVQVSPGTGPAVLLWPSLLMTGDLWAGQAARFGASHRLVLIDPPGHGGSEPLRSAFTFDDCARCVVDLLDGLGIDKAHFVGNSWGGMIGATFAARYPDRLKRAVLMNCTASKAGLAQKARYAAMLRAAAALGGIRPPLTRSALRAFLGPTTLRTRPDVVETVRASLRAVRHRFGPLGGPQRGPRPAGPARPAGNHHGPGSGGCGRGRRHLPGGGNPGHGGVDAQRVRHRARRDRAPRGTGRPRPGERRTGRLPVRYRPLIVRIHGGRDFRE